MLKSSGRMTAAAVTGPASGPLPASSVPHISCGFVDRVSFMVIDFHEYAICATGLAAGGLSVFKKRGFVRI